MSGNFLWSGYLAAGADAIAQATLNSLADGSVILGAEIDNTSNKYPLCDVALGLASVTIASLNAYVMIYVVPYISGYPDFANGAVANYHHQYARCPIMVKAVSAAVATAHGEQIRLPPTKFKFAIRNGLGTAFPASGNTLVYQPYAEAYSG